MPVLLGQVCQSFDSSTKWFKLDGPRSFKVHGLENIEIDGSIGLEDGLEGDLKVILIVMLNPHWPFILDKDHSL